jgi:hypothetical protein
MKTQIPQVLFATITLTFSLHAASPPDWQSKAISPVVNPIFFESPLIQSEVRPLFAYHQFDKGLLGADVDVRVYAVQLRYAVNDRLALIATKDGYMEIDPQVRGAKTQHGWNDIGAGLKYALYRNDEQQIQITPGLTFEIPVGDDEVFQGNGDGEFNLFVSAIKGFDQLHFTANLGARIPIDMDEETANVRYALMVDYYTCQWFIPFATINAVTTISEGEALPFDSEGYDVVNFGSSRAGGKTQAAWGVGFRSRLHKSVDLGFAYEQGFTPNDDIFKDRFTVDLIWRFQV